MILLLVSANFIATEAHWNKEVKVALGRHKAGTARVIPIILKPALWQDTPLGELQALPPGGKAVTDKHWSDQEAAFEEVARGIRDAVENLRMNLREEALRKAPVEVEGAETPRPMAPPVVIQVKMPNAADLTTPGPALRGKGRRFRM